MKRTLLLGGLALACACGRAGGDRTLLQNKGSDTLINRLRKLGSTSIAVEGEDPAEGTMDPVQSRLEIDERFSKVADDPLMAEIKNLVVKIQIGS